MITDSIDQILSAKAANPKADTIQLEKEIDAMVYKLYELTEEEIAIIEIRNKTMSDIKLFEQKQIRSHWDEKEEQWYFSIIDVVEVLTGSSNPRD